MDQSEALTEHKMVRNDMVLEMVTSNDTHDQSQSMAYRKRQYKIMQGNFRDSHWYSEPKTDQG